ncbi:hypothetical protein ABEB36_011969 [Hypothenemus hampei]|uniref:Glypican-6 n=1 Tax=Hypothenemus hampei TaxID=57062 RepID=A0ABD1E9M1_HYPHA
MAVTRFALETGRMCRQQGVFLAFLIFLTVNATIANPSGCDLVRHEINIRGYPSHDILDKPVNGLLCGEGSCCSAKSEEKLLAYNQVQMEKYLKETVIKVALLVENRAKKFDEIFRSMMENSKREFHEMFERTYGKIYLQNAEVFSDFFTELETYYKKGTVRLSETMDTFFGILYQRMFTVINAQYKFDDNYMVCVSNHMLDMKPFGDVPHKLTQQLKRSFVATRTFYKSLIQAAEAIKDVPLIPFEIECLRQLTQMQTCGLCRGEMGPGACSQYCIDTVNVCLKRQIQLSESWDAFVAAIDKVADRLMGPYNVESVVEPLNIKISEAIMTFQDSGTEVSSKIQTKCGTLGLKRPKKDAEYQDEETPGPEEVDPDMEIKFDPILKKNSKKHKKGQEKSAAQTPTLDSLIEDIKTKVKTTKQFWLQLPYQYCNNEKISAAPSENGHCWNGSAIGHYEPVSVKVEPIDDTTIIRQTYVLNGLTDKLRKAYQGQDVEIIDDTEDNFDGSGSGSGDGIEDSSENKGAEEDPSLRKDHTNEVSPPVYFDSSTTTSRPEVVRTSSANRDSPMSLTRALISYLLPMVMVWFGGAIRDLL